MGCMVYSYPKFLHNVTELIPFSHSELLCNAISFANTCVAVDFAAIK